MKNLSKYLTVGSIALLTACTKVPAGYQGVIVNLYGSNKGVSEQSVGVGRYWLGMNKELFVFPTFMQNHTYSQGDSITMQTSEGLTVSTDVGITYTIPAENVTKVFQKYRQGIDEITNVYLRNMIRDSMNQVASTMTVEDLYGPKKEVFIAMVNKQVKSEAKPIGIDVDKVYLVGTFNLPSTVVASINSKIQASQNAMKVENEIATAQAEAQKTIIEAQAKAKANSIINSSLSPEYLQYQMLQKWDGKLPMVSSQGNIPMVKLPEDKK